MEEAIKIKIDEFSNNLSPIKAQVIRYLQNNSRISENGIIKVLHRPWIAPMNWGICLFERVDKSWFEVFSQKTGKEIPAFYKAFLLEVNGCFLYDFSLYGLIPTAYNEGLLNRSIMQCYGLTSANDNWINEYEVDKSLFHFGGRAYSDEENLGYFSNHENEIFSVLKDGNIISKWNNFSDFLNDEIQVAESMMLSEIPHHIELNKNKN